MLNNFDSLRSRLVEIIEKRIQEPEESKSKLEEILLVAKRQLRYDILAEGNYYMAECYFRTGDANAVVKYAYNCITYIGQGKVSQEFLGKAYNLAGVGYCSTGSYSMAQTFYIKGLKYAEKYGDKRTAFATQNNIGSLFLQMGNHMEAQKYIGKVYKAALEDVLSSDFSSLKSTDKADKEEMLYVCCLNMAGIYYQRGDYSVANRYLQTAEDFNLVGKGYFYDLNVVTLKIKLHLAQNQIEEGQKEIEVLLEKIVTYNDSTEIFEDYLDIAGLLIKTGCYTYADKMMTLLLNICHSMNSVNRWMQYYEIMVKLAKEKGDERVYYKMCARYYQYSVKYNDDYNKSMLQALKNQLELDRSMEMQKRESEKAEELRLLSETDELTKLLNRRSFNNLAQKYFTNAMKGDKNFGIVVLDIDYFKQFNDKYGHNAGDECLKEVATILKSHDGNGFLASRYGGDEFVVIVQNKSNEDITGYMDAIISDIREKNIQHEVSEITDIVSVTMGAVNLVPTESQTVLDVFQIADEALYQAKKEGKNRYKLFGEDI